MTLLFRPHRGGFNESMALVEEIRSLNDLTNAVGKQVNGLVSDGMIRCQRLCYDSRNGWDTHLITVTDIGVVGQMNGPMPIK